MPVEVSAALVATVALQPRHLPVVAPDRSDLVLSAALERRATDRHYGDRYAIVDFQFHTHVFLLTSRSHHLIAGRTRRPACSCGALAAPGLNRSNDRWWGGAD